MKAHASCILPVKSVRHVVTGPRQEPQTVVLWQPLKDAYMNHDVVTVSRE